MISKKHLLFINYLGLNLVEQRCAAVSAERMRGRTTTWHWIEANPAYQGQNGVGSWWHSGALQTGG